MRLALGQTNPIIGEVKSNLNKIKNVIKESSAKGANLIQFTECAVTGYCYESRKEILHYVKEGLSEKIISEISGICGSSMVMLGTLEVINGTIRNSILLISSNGLIAKYYKCHLPVLGADRFVTPGEGLCEIIETPFGKIGILVCFELRFPEVARILALKGADIICNPTNVPVGGEAAVDYLGRARALENRVYVSSCNRTGIERNTQFIGKSQVVDPSGNFITTTDDREVILYADINLQLAQNKTIVIKAGEYELPIFQQRKTSMYSPICETKYNNG